MVANRAAGVAQGAGQQDTVQWMADRLSRIEAQLAELGRASPTSLNVKTPGSTSSADVQAYADTSLKWADGSPFVWIRINEKGGRCFQTYPATYVDSPTNSIVSTAAWGLFNPTQSPSWDLISSDSIAGWGLSKPWISVPLYPQFVPVLPGTAGNGAYLGYWNINTAASGVAQGMALWYGEIPLVAWPKLCLTFFGGQASGTVVPTYTLWVGSVQKDSWTSSGGFGWDTRLVDLSDRIQYNLVPVEIRVNWTGSGQMACKIGSCFLRGS